MTEALPVDVVDEPLHTVKLAEVQGKRDPRVHPIGRYHRRHYEYLHTSTARCHRRHHAAPALDCTCGFHAVNGVAELPGVTKVLADSVVLVVELSGTVVQHERGYRGERQSVLGVQFPTRCSWCGEPTAERVVPGRRWRSICLGCAASRRRITSLNRADATARIGVDVAFVDLPGESGALKRRGVGRAVLMWLMMVACCINATRAPGSAALAAGLAYCTVMSTGFVTATVSSRSARSHSRYFIGQCACIVVGSLLTVLASR